MKKLLLLSLGIMLSLSAFSQRFVYVDTDYILEQVPEYQTAQKKLDDMAEGWRQEIDKRYKEIDELYKAYQAEQVLLPEETKIQRQKQIEAKEKGVKDYQKEKFGYEGELFKKKQELIKPIQDKIYNEIQKMATEKSYDFVFDKSGGLNMLFANSRYDKSKDIIEALGYSIVKTENK